MRFRNRIEAGGLLARNIVARNAVVLGIPRGGVVVAKPVAEKLRCMLGVLIVRKIALPSSPEAAFGAMTREGKPLYDEAAKSHLGVGGGELRRIEAGVRKEIERRENLYGRKFPRLKGREVVIVDDGLATGCTMLAAIASVQLRKPEKIIVAVPVAAADAHELVTSACDELVCLHVAHDLRFAVGSYYEEFGDVADREVINILEKSRARGSAQ
ncbi:MAG: phosphoribosyltransferase [Candidatus Aenigmarchaeota archaeon]|nr:phosphoribosyltransferase [Candidatus Aenigmarchaeota archaeon]